MPRPAALALLALVVAGCGGGSERLSHDEYGRRVGTELERLDRTMLSLRPRAASLATLAASLRTTADELDRVAAPEDAAAANNRLVRGLRSFASTVESEREVVAAGRGAEVREALSRIARARGVREIQRAEGDLRRAGYSLPR